MEYGLAGGIRAGWVEYGPTGGIWAGWWDTGRLVEYGPAGGIWVGIIYGIKLACVSELWDRDLILITMPHYLPIILAVGMQCSSSSHPPNLCLTNYVVKWLQFPPRGWAGERRLPVPAAN